MAQAPKTVDKCYALNTRWTLKMLRQVMQERLHWHVTSLSGVWGLLERAHLSRKRAHITVATLRIFHAQLAQQYAQAERIYVVVDNWPVHHHPDVLVDLIEQPYADAFKLPRTWPTEPSRAHPANLLPIVLAPLPTYASWLNPIEKLWRKLRQDLLHLHQQANDWLGLRDQVGTFLEQFTTGSEPLLRYSGLLPE